VISLYARGLSTREIEDHVKQIYGIEISPQFVSRATEQLQQQITDWQSRPLERVYPVVFVDGLRVAVRSEKGVLKKCVYTVLGVNVAGRQEVLGLWVEETEGARFWLKVFNDLKARGVQDILVLCGDGLTGLPEAVRSAFSQTDVQLCVVHQIRNATKFVSFKDRKPFCAAMRPIYTAPTLEAAELALERFAELWGARYPVSIASWRNHWDGLTAFFKYSVEFRRLIYTTNAIESLHSQMCKNIASRKVFPHDDAADQQSDDDVIAQIARQNQRAPAHRGPAEQHPGLHPAVEVSAFFHVGHGDAQRIDGHILSGGGKGVNDQTTRDQGEMGPQIEKQQRQEHSRHHCLSRQNPMLQREPGRAEQIHQGSPEELQGPRQNQHRRQPGDLRDEHFFRPKLRGQRQP
jgi:transposase-like protein